jgi:branched-chain amino acid transport system substrate-binding protein
MKDRVVAATVATLAATMLVAVATPASSSGAPLNITYISSLTGPAATEYGNSQQGCVARVDLQNAEGGVRGRKIDLSIVDDQTNPSLTSTAVQGAISNGAIGIVANSPLFFLAAKYAQQAGVPVTGNSSDGPEWGEQPYTTCLTRSGGARTPKNPSTVCTATF